MVSALYCFSILWYWTAKGGCYCAAPSEVWGSGNTLQRTENYTLFFLRCLRLQIAVIIVADTIRIPSVAAIEVPSPVSTVPVDSPLTGLGLRRIGGFTLAGLGFRCIGPRFFRLRRFFRRSFKITSVLRASIILIIFRNVCNGILELLLQSKDFPALVIHTFVAFSEGFPFAICT